MLSDLKIYIFSVIILGLKCLQLTMKFHIVGIRVKLKDTFVNEFLVLLMIYKWNS